MTATTRTANYRKTRQGEWVVMAPTTDLTAGATITVTKKSGETKTERIARVGRTFTVDGVEMAYGYIAAGATRPSPGRSCESCGSSRGVHPATDMSGVGGYACYRCDDGSLSYC